MTAILSRPTGGGGGARRPRRAARGERRGHGAALWCFGRGETGGEGGARGLRSGGRPGLRARTSPEAPLTRYIPGPLPRGRPHSPPVFTLPKHLQWEGALRPGRGADGAGAGAGLLLLNPTPRCPRRPPDDGVAGASTPSGTLRERRSPTLTARRHRPRPRLPGLLFGFSRAPNTR